MSLSKEVPRNAENMDMDDRVPNDDETFVRCVGFHGASLIFVVPEGHFYDRDSKCAYSEFMSPFDADKKGFKCEAKLGTNSHNHDVPSRESVQLSVFLWRCKLRVFLCGHKETVDQTMDSVLKEDSQSFSIPAKVIKSMFADTLVRYRLMAENKDPYESFFQSCYCQFTWGRFLKVVKKPQKYWSDQSKGCGDTKRITKINQKKVETTANRLLNNLDEIIKKTKTVVTTVDNKESLSQFIDIVSKYKVLLKQLLTNGAVETKIRYVNKEEEYDRIISVAECHGLFGKSHLEEWLDLKEDEFEIIRIIKEFTASVGISVVNKKQLTDKLLNKNIGKPFALVLRFPLLDEKTTSLIKMMNRCVQEFEENGTLSNEKYDTVKKEKNLVDEKEKKEKMIHEVGHFFQHVRGNVNLKNNFNFFISFDRIKSMDHEYSLYKNGSLVLGNIVKLPSPPTRLRLTNVKDVNTLFKKETGIEFGLEWDCEEVHPITGYVIEFRPKGSSPDWPHKILAKSVTSMIFVEPVELRMAAITSIGSSVYSEIHYIELNGSGKVEIRPAGI